MCGADTISELGRIERNILNTLAFKCQHHEEFGCEAVVQYQNIRKHLTQECVHKIELPEEVKIVETKKDPQVMEQE